MSIAFSLYLCDLASNINAFLLVMFWIPIIVLIITYFFSGVTLSIEGECEFKMAKLIYSKIWIALLAGLLSLPIPSKNTMYLMLGSSYLQNSALPSKVSQALELKLDDVIDQLKNKEKK